MKTRCVWENKFSEFDFDEGGHFLEQLAHAEALGVAAELGDDAVASLLRQKLPGVVRNSVISQMSRSKKGMSLVWEVAERVVSGLEPELLWNNQYSEDDLQDQEQAKGRACWSCGQPGHIARNCGVARHNNAKKCRRGA